MSALDLEAIKARCAARTTDADDIAALIAEVERLRSGIDALSDVAARAVEHVDAGHFSAHYITGAMEGLREAMAALLAPECATDGGEL